MKLFNHTTCEVVSKQDTNSTSKVEIASKVCLARLQNTAPPTNIKIYLDVDFRQSTQPVKSESSS